MPEAQELVAYVRDGYGAFYRYIFVCGCCEMLVFRVCGARQNLYACSIYRNPDSDDQIYECLLTSMAAVQAEDRHGVAAFDFASLVMIRWLSA